MNRYFTKTNTNGQQTEKRMLKFTCREMQMKVKMRRNFINTGMAEIKKTSNKLLVGIQEKRYSHIADRNSLFEKALGKIRIAVWGIYTTEIKASMYK